MPVELDLQVIILYIFQGKAVQGWKHEKDEMVAYKSFVPFLPLLQSTDKPNVQLWAMWALHHVTANNSQ